MLQHLPLITRRIEFTPLAHTPRPSITAHQEFAIAQERSLSPPLIDPGSPSLSDASDASDGSMHSDDENPSGSIVGDDGVDNEDVKIIPKPPGEPGRPKSGGYNLEKALGWPDAIYQQVIKHVHHEAHQRLETRKSFKNQSVEEIQAICGTAMNKHSILQVYENAWPVCDMLKLRLKYTSEKAHCHKGKKMQQNLAQVVRDGSMGIDL
ncbi:hypothetical protein ARMGADRAFT_1082717 [Armillaria gallica]|uniref:Uncharacterized protein n=1 Tax=Armillaria gallica TaxID=47427 RepID=A0A2H3DG69_ARMGA|nr:hypothetical protein ARMGADRAFT_1082717 [Armillaria gallica]